MKYTITINQSGLVNAGLLSKTDWIEWFIVDYLKDFVIYKQSKRVIYQHEEYIWLNYNHLIASLPMIKLNSKSAISKRISRLERLGLIKTLRAKDNTLYYTFTDKLIDICFARKKDIERLKTANPNIPDTPCYPQLRDPVLRRETDPVLLRRTAQYNTNNTIINKDNNKDISFSSSLKTKERNPTREAGAIRKGLPYKNPINSVKGFSSFSNVWKVVENIRQRGLNNEKSKSKISSSK